MNKSLSLAALSIVILAVGCTDQRFKKPRTVPSIKLSAMKMLQKLLKEILWN